MAIQEINSTEQLIGLPSQFGDIFLIGFMMILLFIFLPIIMRMIRGALDEENYSEDEAHTEDKYIIVQLPKQKIKTSDNHHLGSKQNRRNL